MFRAEHCDEGVGDCVYQIAPGLAYESFPWS